MTTSKDLELYGINVSTDFLRKNISLNEGLKKVASTKGLNKQQIKRVAEHANVNTYLEMFKVAKDKYLLYDLADAEKVYGELVKTSSVNSDDSFDYKGYSETSNLSISEIFDLYKKSSSLQSEEVLNSVINSRQELEKKSEFRNKSMYLEGLSNYLNSRYTEKLADFDQNLINLTKEVKQSILSGSATFSDVSNIIKTAAPSLGEVELEYLKSKLSHLPLSENSSNKLPNPDSSLYKTAELLETDFLYISKIKEAYDFHRNEYDELRKTNNAPNMLKHAGFFDLTSNSFNWFREHPKTSAAMAMLVAYKVGKAHQKSKTENKKVPLTKNEINLRLQRYKGN